MSELTILAIPLEEAMDLRSIMACLDGMSLSQIEDLARDLYSQIYLQQGHFGLHRTHDGQVVIFHKNQFDHAFFTTSDKHCHPERKDCLRKGSVERIRWIEQLICGKVPGSACFEVPSPTGRRKPPNRLYAVYETPFVVWLEPRKDDGWKFSSAYPLSIEEVRKYSRGGRTVWKHEWKNKAP